VWVGILLLRPINSSVISPENETVKEAWIMRSRNVYCTYKSSFSDFVSHDPINKSTVFSWQFACFFQSKFAKKHIMIYIWFMFVLHILSKFSHLHVSSLFKFLSALHSYYVNFRLHQPNLITSRILLFINYIFIKY